MSASVIVRSKDESDRLRLTLASLQAQTQTAEIVVVNDGSTDHTQEVVAAAAEKLRLVYVEYATSTGRSAAANAGAARASGEILIFLDGDTLAAPDLVARHLEVHRSAPGNVARGETFHLRCTRFFQDPELGSAIAGAEAHLQRLSASELARMRITRADIRERFDEIHARAQPGVYPGAGPRRLYELEMEALRDHPGCSVLWAAASGSNQSIASAHFRDGRAMRDPRRPTDRRRREKTGSHNRVAGRGRSLCRAGWTGCRHPHQC